MVPYMLGLIQGGTRTLGGNINTFIASATTDDLTFSKFFLY